MKYLIAFCCNDERGNFTGRVDQIGIGDEVRLYWPGVNGPAMKWTERPRYTHVQISRSAFSTRGKRQMWVGNIFWDAIDMDEKQARELLAWLLVKGWKIEEHAEDGPLADLLPAPPRDVDGEVG